MRLGGAAQGKGSTLKAFRFTLPTAAAAVLMFALAGCSAEESPTAEPEVVPTELSAQPESSQLGDDAEERGAETQASLGAVSIEDVFAKINCELGDLLGTRGMITELENSDHNPVMLANGTCTPIEGGDMVFFYEYGSPEDARLAVENHSIEAYPGELFQDGAVLILARDNPEQALVGVVAEQVN